jgi:drug/metabolite transporter (DMT)-like permease
LDLSVAALGGFVGYTLLFAYGIKLTSTAHAALILAASPIFTGLIGFTVSKNWPQQRWWIGAAIALLGEVILIGYRNTGGTPSTATLTGDLIMLASVLFSSAGYVAGGRLSAHIGTWATTAWAISLAGVVLLPVFLLRLNLAQTDLAQAAPCPGWRYSIWRFFHPLLAMSHGTGPSTKMG